MKILINNEEVVCNQQLEIKEEMLSTSSTVLNNCYPKSWELDKDYVNRFYYPKDYSNCLIYDNNDDLIFSGVVKNTGNISLNPFQPHYCSLQLLDYKTLLSEGETLDFVISEKTVSEAIQLVINAVSDYGFVVGNIEIYGANDIIGAYSTSNKSAYDVLQYLAGITQSKWTTRVIDENTVAIDFYDPELMTRAEDLEYTQEYFKENGIDNISFNYGTNDYRNKQVMLSDEVYASIDYNETVIANGYTRIFNLENNIGIIKNIYINGVAKTFATVQEKELGLEADFYYEAGKNQLTSNDNQSIIPVNTQIVVIYTPLVKGREVVYNADEVSRIQGQINRKGVIARYENRNDILSSEELNKVGQSYIRYKGSAEVKLKIETFNNDLYNIGNVVYFNAPIDDLKKDYMVKSKSRKMIIVKNEINIFYTYELTSNFNSENAINYFDNQRNKTTGNISAGEFIVRNIDIENSANIIFKNNTNEEITFIGNNTLNCPLNAPFVE